MKVYMVYDTRDSDICVGQFDNAQAVADYFGITRGGIYSGISRGVKVKHRYRVEIVEMEG